MPKCKECLRIIHRNYYNELEFEMDLLNEEMIGDNRRPHNLKFQILHFFDSNTKDFKHKSTFNLVLDDGIGGKTEMHICEEVKISQLKRLYNFLDYVFNKEGVE